MWLDRKYPLHDDEEIFVEEMGLHGSQPRLDNKISMGTTFLYHL